MTILAAIVGINHWLDLTMPFAMSVATRNPTMTTLVIDNGSEPPYPECPLWQTSRIDRCGYNHALNHALSIVADWYVLFNNDCMAHREFENVIPTLDKRTLYGSGWQWCDNFQRQMLYSAWLCMSRELVNEVGLFDPQLDAGFEDFDYQMRCLDKGIRLEVLRLDCDHLDKHTRLVEPDYGAKWEKCRKYFDAKWHCHTPQWRI